ncbi:3-keto-5-aminohexanoate cleavage protein [Dactylosporangium sp. CA-092794]|uniref:3-keto-5-aminohexanoate cleavage protein n=1 Tax=Dactylosporangium sp. CA-092794 TaxID=3239929 RepID=UPI003D946200
MLSPIARIKVALNGGRPAGAHPGLPVTPVELAAAARAAVSAGAEAVHLHPRAPSGAESLAAADVGAAIAAVRESCPATTIGVTTGLWITGRDEAARQRAVAGWEELPEYRRPDFASVNVAEPGFTALVATLTGLGVAVEAGVWTLADAGALSIAGRLPRVLVEIMQRHDDPVQILARLDEAGVAGERLLHGEGELCWPMVALAGRLGLPTRIGLEDTLTGPGGEPVADNAELVRLALSVWSRAATSP